MMKINTYFGLIIELFKIVIISYIGNVIMMVTVALQFVTCTLF